MTDGQLREKIARQRISAQITHEEALTALIGHTTFMYEDYTSVNDLAHHLYKLVDANLMPYGVMCNIMNGSESYFGEKWA